MVTLARYFNDNYAGKLHIEHRAILPSNNSMALSVRSDTDAWLSAQIVRHAHVRSSTCLVMSNSLMYIVDSRAKSGSMHRREKVNLTTPVYEEQTTPTISLNVTIANDK